MKEKQWKGKRRRKSIRSGKIVILALNINGRVVY